MGKVQRTGEKKCVDVLAAVFMPNAKILLIQQTLACSRRKSDTKRWSHIKTQIYID